MENQYKKALAKIVAVFSITTVFLFGFDKPAYASDQADNLSASTVSEEGSADYLEMVEYMEEEDDDLAENIQEGVESPYSKEITQEHIDAVKAISGESDDVYKKMIAAYEKQQQLRVSLEKHKSQKITKDELKAHKTEYKNAHKEYRDAHEKSLPKVVQKTGELSLKCKAGDCTDADKLQLNKYKLFTDASVSDLKLSTNQFGKLELHEVSSYIGFSISKLSDEDRKLLRYLSNQEAILKSKIMLYNSFGGDRRLEEVNAANDKRTELLVQLGIVDTKKTVQSKEKISGTSKPSVGGNNVGDNSVPKITGVRDDLRITQEDVKVLEDRRNELGAKYSEELKSGINDPKDSLAAEELFSVSKKLFELQRKLDDAISLKDRTASDSDKFQARVEKAGKLQKEYDEMQAKYSQLKSNTSLSGNVSNKNTASEKTKRAQLDKIAKEMEDSNGSSQAKKDLADFRDANPEITEADVNSALYKAATLRKQEAEADAAKKKNEKDKAQRAQLDELAKNAVDSNDMTELNKFMAANPDVKEEARESALRKAAVLKKQQEKERKAKENQNQDSLEKEKDVVPVPKYKEKQNKTKIATDKNGDYIRVDQGSKKSSHKAVVAVQRSTPSKVTNEVVKAAEPTKSSVKANYNTTATKTTNSSNVKIKEDNNVNRINLLNEALSQ
ncbi:MAG: hypothetical protein N4A31_00180 [Rickettsiales bacterium]|jgi:hypothetical protein|nr:hypothetical protein [Rickettsiales bacterium]